MAIIDLTGTKWTIETMNCVAGYGVFELEGSIIENSRVYELRRLYIGYDTDEDGEAIPTPNNILYLFENGKSGWYGGYIEITGGTDATNADLISWLEANGTLIPLIENKKNMYVGGNKVSKVMVGGKAAKKILIGDKVIYEE